LGVIPFLTRTPASTMLKLPEGLFVTGPEADSRSVNHALLCMRDLDTFGGEDDVFKLVRPRESH
jgi:hypothetical protein